MSRPEGAPSMNVLRRAACRVGWAGRSDDSARQQRAGASVVNPGIIFLALLALRHALAKRLRL